MARYESALTSGLGHRFYQSNTFLAIGERAYQAMQGGLVSPGVPALSPAELQPARALIRSKFWRAARDGGRPLLVLTAHEESLFESGESANSQLADFHVIVLERAIAEATNLTFFQKGLNTLENLHDAWRNTGKLPNIPYALSNRELVFGHLDREEDGMAYGCDEQTASMVYSWLRDEGYIKGRAEVAQQHIELTPSALIVVEHLKSGKEAALRRGFFIRRYDEATDAFFRPILDEVARATGCEINAVWEKQKNEKLDELILRRIRESSVIVLDVTGERFNVGLEAGYALALRKQMIVLRDKAEKDGDLPFDIRTMNCFFYDRNEPDKLQEKLTERVLDALEEAKIGTH